MPANQNDLTVNATANGTTTFILNVDPFEGIAANGVTVVDNNSVAANRYQFTVTAYRTETTPGTPYRLLITMTTTRPAGANPPTPGAIRVLVATTNNGAAVVNDTGPLAANFVVAQNMVGHPPTVPVQTLVYGEGTGEQELILPVTGLWGVSSASIVSEFGNCTWLRGGQTPGNFWTCVQFVPFPAGPPRVVRLPDFRVTLNMYGGGTYLVPDFPVNFVSQT